MTVENTAVRRRVAQTPDLPPGRLIVSQPLGGAENMAIDQAILENADQTSRPTLRFYRWLEPTLSLGYFQSIHARQQHRDSADLPVVRRSSGGGAIVHDRELTYSLVLPQTGNPSRGGAIDVYRAVHQAFIDALRDWGITCQRFADSGCAAAYGGESFLCFQRRNSEDLLVSGYKVLGSAQRRGACALLQHGSFLLESSPVAPELPGIQDLTSRRIAIDQLIDHLATTLEPICGCRWNRDTPSKEEETASRSILKERYGALSWTEKR